MSTEIVESVEEVCGIYFRSVLIPMAGTTIPQHTHDHDHATYVGSGSVMVYVDGDYTGTYVAGQAIPISAGKSHSFETLLPNTRLACVHDVASAESVKRKGL